MNAALSWVPAHRGGPAPAFGSICFWESFGERSEFAEKPAAHLSRKVEATVNSCMRFVEGSRVTKQTSCLTWKKWKLIGTLFPLKRSIRCWNRCMLSGMLLVFGPGRKWFTMIRFSREWGRLSGDRMGIPETCRSRPLPWVSGREENQGADRNWETRREDPVRTDREEAGAGTRCKRWDGILEAWREV